MTGIAGAPGNTLGIHRDRPVIANFWERLKYGHKLLPVDYVDSLHFLVVSFVLTTLSLLRFVYGLAGPQIFPLSISVSNLFYSPPQIN